MRITRNINEGWSFYLDRDGKESNHLVDLPHTWNNIDGQDGGQDYYRGKGVYTKTFYQPASIEGLNYYLEFGGVNSIAEVYLNGEKVKEHRGGYSIFRVDITEELLKDDVMVEVVADNRDYDDVYPSKADFTFYGGIYRPVKMIVVPETHFDLDYYGSQGVAVSSTVEDNKANLRIRAWIENLQPTDLFQTVIYDGEGIRIAEFTVPASEEVDIDTHILNPELWQGIEDPYLYTIDMRILRGNDILDEISIQHGIREFSVDPQEGYYLNGEHVKLRGVSRHQDRAYRGNALTKADHEQDAEIIKDIGANTVRLAHYQQDQYFYDLSDQYGFAVWAEIPFISVFKENDGARENTLMQMKELVVQSYNHASIQFWGVSNEISIDGESEALVDNMKELNDLVHELDDTRLTTLASVTMLDPASELNFVTDIFSYNHYYGWYLGELEDNEKWFDKFHETYPDRAIGLSEYGAEGIINWHSEEPKQGDYTEEYHALYHEHMAKMIDERDYLWSSHVWNMFDFGADNRDEGGVKGRNNKGLVTFDREIKKDAYYIYKAYWSNEPFVHVNGSRFAYRPGDSTTVKVYSNQKTVTLVVDGKAFKTLKENKANPHVFIFENVPLSKDKPTVITADAIQAKTSSITLRGVDELPAAYQAPVKQDSETVVNWFNEGSDEQAPDFTFEEGYYSVKNTVSEVMENPEAKNVLTSAIENFADEAAQDQSLFLVLMKDDKINELTKFFPEDKESDTYKWINQELQKIEK